MAKTSASNSVYFVYLFLLTLGGPRKWQFVSELSVIFLNVGAIMVAELNIVEYFNTHHSTYILSHTLVHISSVNLKK